MCSIGIFEKMLHTTNDMVEVLLSGIVIGLVQVTVLGLFVAAYIQYQRATGKI